MVYAGGEGGGERRVEGGEDGVVVAVVVVKKGRWEGKAMEKWNWEKIEWWRKEEGDGIIVGKR